MLSVTNLCKDYHTLMGTKRVLDNVNLQVKKGQRIGILGRNGSGKSTLVRLLGGAGYPTSGRIERGMRISWPLGYSGAFQPNLTGLDNLRFICRMYGADYAKLLPDIADFADLGPWLREPVMHYSTGMRTRLAFALSLAIEFDCFLVDEVFSAGDARFQKRCHEELFVKRRHCGMILVSHHTDAITMHCDSAAVLKDGKLHAFADVGAAFEFYNAEIAAESSSTLIHEIGMVGETLRGWVFNLVNLLIPPVVDICLNGVLFRTERCAGLIDKRSLEHLPDTTRTSLEEAAPGLETLAGGFEYVIPPYVSRNDDLRVTVHLHDNVTPLFSTVLPARLQ